VLTNTIANPNTNPIPVTNPNLTLLSTNPKLQARRPEFYHLPDSHVYTISYHVNVYKITQ